MYSYNHSRILKLVLGLSIFFFCNSVDAKLFYQWGGQEISLTAPQLWYDGYWQQAGWINGTLIPYTSSNLTDNIALLFGPEAAAPFDAMFRKLCKEKPIGILVVTAPIPGPVGASMYTIDGLDQSMINVPIAQVFQKPGQLTTIPEDGIDIQLLPDVNEWKVANDASAFQIVFNVVLTGLQVAMILIGYHRLRLFWIKDGFSPTAIAQICIIMSIISAFLRCLTTIIDPFYTFRIVPAIISTVFITISFPFEFASGILLTFFWAETLTVSKVSATPFISEYKKSAIVVIVLLFVGEIVCTAVGSRINNSSFQLGFIPLIFFLVVSFVLTICYTICAINILRRVVASNSGHRRLTKMTWRLVGSVAGYVVFILCALLLTAYTGYPWAWKILMNVAFLSSDVTGILQVYSFKPVREFRYKGGSHSSAVVSKSDSVIESDNHKEMEEN